MPRRSATPVAEGPEHTIMEESDGSLVEAAQDIFADDISPPEEPPDLSAIRPDSIEDDERAAGIESTATSERIDFRPGIKDMVTVRGGGLYLPVRRRVGWMRGEPDPHPDWTIDTIPEKIVEGTFKGSKVEGGYARIRANVFNSEGRLIATGTKTEYSERFLDFVEKAETGAIGRALAVAGYGTEAAIDLDEGLEKERIADAPVAAPGRPINITASSIPGVRPGGRPTGIQNAQIGEIARLNNALGLGLGLVTLIESVTGEEVPPLTKGEENEQLLAHLKTFTHEQAGKLIQLMTKVLRDQNSAAMIEP